MAMQTYYPTAASPYLNERTIAALSVTIGAPKVATEIDAATSLDLTCAIADWYPDFQQGTTIGRRRACDATGKQKLNPLELTLPPLAGTILGPVVERARPATPGPAGAKAYRPGLPASSPGEAE